jgi:hypothetical protein
MNPPTPEEVVQRNLEAYNRHDLDVFVGLFTSDAVAMDLVSGVRWLEGARAFRTYFTRVFSQQPYLHGVVIARLVLDNLVVDVQDTHFEPQKSLRSILIFEVRDHLTKRMITLDPEEMQPAAPPEPVVDQFLAACHARDLAQLLAVYAENGRVVDGMTGVVKAEGQAALQANYGAFFEQASGLPIQVVQRVTLGNYVVQHERLPASVTPTLAVYQVKNRRIQCVWLLKSNEPV